MTLGTRELQQITGDVFALVLELPVMEETDAPLGGDTVAARVGIDGAWRGTLVLRVGPALGRRLAAAMFERDVTAITDEDLRDAVGELGNMIAGNVKGLLAGEATLTLPTVGPWHPPEAPRGGAPLVSLPLSVLGERFQVMLLGDAPAVLVG